MSDLRPSTLALDDEWGFACLLDLTPRQDGICDSRLQGVGGDVRLPADAVGQWSLGAAAGHLLLRKRVEPA